MSGEWTDLYDNGELRIGEAAQAHIDRAIDLMPLAALPPGHIRVTRVLVYEGEPAAVLTALGRSLNDGCRSQTTYRIHARTIAREGKPE